MLFKLVIKEGKLQNDTLNKVLASLDGTYLVSIKQLNVDKSPRDYQEEYFAKIDTCVAHTGHSRYEIHEGFKAHQLEQIGLGSTKDLSTDQWRSWIEDFSWYAYNEMDCIV